MTGEPMGLFGLFLSTYLKFFFLLTPFFVLSSFISLTRHQRPAEKRRTALKVTLAVSITCLVLFFLGNFIFAVFGITLNAFRIGTGAILFLSAISLMKETESPKSAIGGKDISVVPLSIPIAVGPGTTGALLVMGTDIQSFSIGTVSVAGLLLAILSVGVLLYLSHWALRLLGKEGIKVLSKITGLIIAALAAQIMMTGYLGFLGKN